MQLEDAEGLREKIQGDLNEIEKEINEVRNMVEKQQVVIEKQLRTVSTFKNCMYKSKDYITKMNAVQD